MTQSFETLPSITDRAKWALLAVLPQRVRRFHVHRRVFGSWPNLRQPSLFSEKLAWRYVYDRRKILEATCDKLQSKDYALGRGRHLGLGVPSTRWVGEKPSAETLATLSLSPDHHWVLKPNHLSSGRVLFGVGRSSDNQDIDGFVRWCKADEFRLRTTGWAYAKARKVFLIEDRIGLPGDDLPDYKLHVFDGKVACVQVITDRWENPSKVVYGRDWSVLSGDVSQEVPPPSRLEDMIRIGEVVASEFDYMRVDLYLHDDQIWFGEFTSYPSFSNIVNDPDLNAWLGSMWTLPSVA